MGKNRRVYSSISLIELLWVTFLSCDTNALLTFYHLNDRCEKHKIYVGEVGDELKHVGTLRKGKNVYKGKFEAGKTYEWRVDCATGEKVTGDVWEFTLVEPNTDDAKLLTKTRCMKEIEA